MTVTVYRSTDASAPSLTGQVGALITVLDACLVNGYGAKPAAGWAKAFAGTNLASYRAASGNRFYLGVDDTNAQATRIRGFETMTTAGVAVGSGTGPFPTDVQQSGGDYAYKSAAASAQVRPWVIFASATFMMMLIDQTTSSVTPTNAASYTMSWYFGDFFSFAAGDAYNTICKGNAASGGSDSYNLMYTGATTLSGADTNYAPWAPRVAAGTGASLQLPKLGLFGINGSGSVATFPYPMNGIAGIELHPVYLTQGPTTPMVRGQFPGLWHTAQLNSSFTLGDTFSGAVGTAIAGRTFEVVKNPNAGYGVFIETSDWAALGA